MEESILTDVKHALGIDKTLSHFDPDIVMFINAAFFSLNQLGVGGIETYRVISGTEKWSDFYDGRNDLEAIKTYIYLKVRQTFDPPPNSFAVQSIKEQIKELEWRLNVYVDNDIP